MNQMNRREFLAFVGGTGAVAALGSLNLVSSAYAAPLSLSFTPLRLPHPLAIYTTNASFLPTAIGGAGAASPASSNAELSSYTVIDDVVVPPEFERYVILEWGQRVFPDSDDYVGYNHDFTAFIPLLGTEDGLLWVNHEYTSYPFHEAAPGTSAASGNPAFGAGVRSFESVVTGLTLPNLSSGANPGANVELVGESMYNVGGSIVRIKRTTRGGRFAPIVDSRNRRIHGLSGLGLNAGPRTGTYPSAWGATAHQTGDQNYLIGTGPAVADVFVGVNADGLSEKIIGTFANCSGGVTPWGTVLSAEENFQGSGSFSNTATSYPFYMGVTEGVTNTGTQTGYTANTSGTLFGQVGEKYGWLVEISPKDASFRSRKHTALGRFRHENMAIRVEAGKPLVVYSGDDRRGGHVWKFVSDGSVSSVSDPANSALFESGTLYVARFNPDGPSNANGMATGGTGVWIPIALNTPCNPIDPQILTSVHAAQQTSNTAEITGRLNLPQRTGIAGGTTNGGFFNLNVSNRATVNAATGLSYLDDYRVKPAAQGGGAKTLADFYANLGAALCDAYAAGGLAGGTPCARPEDIEIHPVTKEVFISMTDGRPSSDGYPDSRVFVDAKYKADINAEQQSGALYKIAEVSADGVGTTFTWSRFVQAGEDGATEGAGFANVDNLIFDAKSNLWAVTDMTTNLHNAVNSGPTPTQLPVSHSGIGSSAAENLVGTYGNNWMFYVPTSGADAGAVVPFAVGPVRCEMTGPTFVGNTLLVSVQHPSEDSPTAGAVSNFVSTIEMLKLDGSGTFTQTRNVPTGSNWPSNIQGNSSGYPKPCTIGIRRKNGGAFI